MDRLLVGCLAASAVGLVVLAAAAELATTKAVPLSRLDRFEGQRACVDARLAHLRVTGSGGSRWFLADGDASIAIWAPFVPPRAPGDLVRTCGEVERTPTSWTLRVRRPADMDLLAPWDTEAVPLAALAQAPWRYDGQQVLTWGLIVDEGGRWFATDASGASRLYVTGAAAWPHGASTRLSGVISYEAADSRFQLRLDAPPAPGPP